MSFAHLASRSTSDALLPGFVKSAGGVPRNTPRDAKKDSRTVIPGGKLLNVVLILSF